MAAGSSMLSSLPAPSDRHMDSYSPSSQPRRARCGQTRCATGRFHPDAHKARSPAQGRASKSRLELGMDQKSIPPMPPPPGIAGSSFFGSSATIASVVIIRRGSASQENPGVDRMSACSPAASACVAYVHLGVVMVCPAHKNPDTLTRISPRLAYPASPTIEVMHLSAGHQNLQLGPSYSGFHRILASRNLSPSSTISSNTRTP